MDNLDFGAGNLDDLTQDLSTLPPSQSDNTELHRYDKIQDVQDKRKNIIYDIKAGKLDPKDYPLIFQQFAKILDILPDGRFVYRLPPTQDKSKENYYLALRTKLMNFISTGKIADALASSGTPEIKRIAREIADEVMLQIPLDTDHPTRKILSLYKNGTLQDIINFNIKKKHYDIFDQSWVDKTLNPLVMNLIAQTRKGEKAAARGDLVGAMREEINHIKDMIRKVYSE